MIQIARPGTKRDQEYLFTWLGLPARRRTLSLLEASDAIPAFTRRPFQVGPGVPCSAVNPYYDVIVRLPTDEEPTEVPVGLVSRNYQLVQHHAILQRAAATLSFLGIDLEKVQVCLDLTIHGERMTLGLLFPKDSDYSFCVRPGDLVALYLEFINSVDGSLRFALRVSWLRLICSNGLMTREVVSNFSRMHSGGEILSEFEAHLPGALESVVDQKELFAAWLKAKINEQAFEAWIEKTVRKTWGVKAAVRAYHIALRGVDVNIEKMVRGVPAAAIPFKDTACVVGALTDSLNAFAISQALTWLAGERRELQEQLDWKSQVFQMITSLVQLADNG